MTEQAPQLRVFARDASFEEIARAIEKSGFVRVDQPADGGSSAPFIATWSNGRQQLHYAYDRASGVQTLAAPDGLPPALSAGLPTMPTGELASLQSLLPLFAGDRKSRLQALRSMSVMAGGSRRTAARLVASALGDRDWEVSATAMLAAARLGERDLAPDIARLSFPEDASLGLGRHENRILLAARDATLEMLGHGRGRRLPEGLIAAIRGDPSGLDPDVGAFLHSLVLPLPAEFPGPAPATTVQQTSYGPQTVDGVLLVWVPPMRYWLGHRAQPRGEPNPARSVDLGQGFYIEAEARPPAGYDGAEAAAAARATDLGRPVRLSSSDEWEMAARGPDGRRYPWGQNADRALRVDLSPWGMADTISGPGEWLKPEQPDGPRLVTAGESSLLLSARTLAKPNCPYSFRFVYPLA